MSDEEKRRSPRYRSKQSLWCEGQDEGLETRNISASGMFVVTDEAPEVGSQLKVSFDEEGGHIELNMEVMWSGEQDGEEGKQGVGLRIVGFDEGADAYERFVARLAEGKPGTNQEPAAADADAPDGPPEDDR